MAMIIQNVSKTRNQSIQSKLNLLKKWQVTIRIMAGMALARIPTVSVDMFQTDVEPMR